MVRRCFNKATGKPYAVKIIDKLSDAGGVDIETTTRDEVNILLALQGHRNISKSCYNIVIVLKLSYTVVPILVFSPVHHHERFLLTHSTFPPLLQEIVRFNLNVQHW